MKEIENYKKEHLNSQNGQSSTLKLSEILSQRHLDSVCTHLVNEAVLRMSGDNVTCILLVFPTIFIEKNSLNNDDHHSKISSVSNNDKDNDDDGDDDDDDDKTSEPSSKLPRIEK
uniref:Uncharacterized protein n=1 Tax=Trichobilharzia regenti TaxID=157069 RepID=A0AA85JTU1_TRIRE|nr:unnamed protein product [Trichobilharzia regenti]